MGRSVLSPSPPSSAIFRTAGETIRNPCNPCHRHQRPQGVASATALALQAHEEASFGSGRLWSIRPAALGRGQPTLTLNVIAAASPGRPRRFRTRGVHTSSATILLDLWLWCWVIDHEPRTKLPNGSFRFGGIPGGKRPSLPPIVFDHLEVRFPPNMSRAKTSIIANFGTMFRSW